MPRGDNAEVGKKGFQTTPNVPALPAGPNPNPQPVFEPNPTPTAVTFYEAYSALAEAMGLPDGSIPTEHVPSLTRTELNDVYKLISKERRDARERVTAAKETLATAEQELADLTRRWEPVHNERAKRRLASAKGLQYALDIGAGRITTTQTVTAAAEAKVMLDVDKLLPKSTQPQLTAHRARTDDEKEETRYVSVSLVLNRRDLPVTDTERGLKRLFTKWEKHITETNAIPDVVQIGVKISGSPHAVVTRTIHWNRLTNETEITYAGNNPPKNKSRTLYTGTLNGALAWCAADAAIAPKNSAGFPYPTARYADNTEPLFSAEPTRHRNPNPNNGFASTITAADAD